MEADILELSRQLEHPTLGASQALGHANGARRMPAVLGWAGNPALRREAPAARHGLASVVLLPPPCDAGGRTALGALPANVAANPFSFTVQRQRQASKAGRGGGGGGGTTAPVRFAEPPVADGAGDRRDPSSAGACPCRRGDTTPGPSREPAAAAAAQRQLPSPSPFALHFRGRLSFGGGDSSARKLARGAAPATAGASKRKMSSGPSPAASAWGLWWWRSGEVWAGCWQPSLPLPLLRPPAPVGCLFIHSQLARPGVA